MVLRHADDFIRLAPSILTVALYDPAIWLMSRSVRQLDVRLAYAIWAGAGTALTAVIGMVLFSEPAHATRLLGIAMIVGVLALHRGVG